MKFRELTFLLHVREALGVLLMNQSALLLFPPADNVHEFTGFGDLLFIIESSGKGFRTGRVNGGCTLFTVPGATVRR